MQISDWTGGVAPKPVTTTSTSQTGLPDWYQEMTKGIGEEAIGLYGQQLGQEGGGVYGGPRVADFNADQFAAMNAARQNQGIWQGGLQQAFGSAGNIQSAANQGTSAALGYAGQGAHQWDNTAAQQYMSPYMSQVTDNIARLGNRNFTENIMPGIDSTFAGTGQYGSSRNADILGRAARDVQADITGQQAQALNTGYQNAQTAYGNDMNRYIQAGQVANQAGQIGSNAAQSAMQGYSNLAGQQANLAAGDVASLSAAGQMQYGQDQARLTSAQNTWTEAQQQPWQQLQNVSALTRGMQLPQTTAASNQQFPTAYGASPLQQVAGAGAISQTGKA